MTQKLRVPPCPERASGHAWQLAREHSTEDCQAEACEACGLIRMTSYRTGQTIRYEPAGDTAGTPLEPQTYAQAADGRHARRQLPRLDPRRPPRRQHPARARAAAGFQAHRYTRLEIDLHRDTLSIRETIGAGRLEPQTYAALNAGRALVQSGVATHLNNNGRVTAPQVLAAIRTAVNAGSERTILDSASRSSIDAINGLDQIDPGGHSQPYPGRRQPGPAMTTTGTTADTRAHRHRTSASFRSRLTDYVGPDGASREHRRRVSRA